MALLRLIRGSIGGGWQFLVASTLFCQSSNSNQTNGNRLVYLDESDLSIRTEFPKADTHMDWEAGVDAAVILAIDDMREPKKYETYMRPILDRLSRSMGARLQHHDDRDQR